jgi:exosome complex component RRP42
MARSIMSEIRKDHIIKLLQSESRLDGREFNKFREVTIETGVVESAEGSARVKMGNTDVLVGLKMSVGTPFGDTPNMGVLATGAELIPLASADFESGPPGEIAIELARVVDRGIRESKMIDLEALCITPGEAVWMNFVDIYALDYDGNLFDAAALAAVAALKTAVVPASAHGRGEDFPLPTTCTPISVTSVKIENSILVDPSLDEEMVASARLTVTSDENGDLRAMQKGMRGALTVDEVKSIVDQSIEIAKELRKLIG